MLSFLFAALAWQSAVDRDPLGSPVYVAEVKPDAVHEIRFLCGGITGVVLQFNLGEMEHGASAFSREVPKPEAVRFAFLEGGYDTTAVRAPITDGLGTYEIKGSEAAFVAGLMKDSDAVTVRRGEVSFRFSLAGARDAIGAAMGACPFKYDQ